MTEQDADDIRAIVLEELYEVFREAEDDIEYESRKSPLGAGGQAARIIRSTINSRFRELYPAAYEAFAKRITEVEDEDEDEDQEEGEEEENTRP